MRTSMRKFLAICVAFILLLGCAPSGNELTEGPMPITVSIRPHAWLVREIGGPHVDVQTLVSPGDSPHSYQPSDAQISRLMASRAFFRCGVPFERGPWFEALQSAGSVRIVDLREGIELREMESSVPHGQTHAEQDHSEPGDRHAAGSAAHDHNHDHGHLHAGLDPHIWLSPRLLKHQAQTVASVLQGLDPENAEPYRRNLDALVAELNRADARIRELLGAYQGRSFLVFHPAWGYFADEYGLRQVAIEIQGKEPSDREMTELQQFARDEQIRVVFVQPQIEGASARAVAEAIGGRVEVLDPLAEDVSAELVRAAEAIAQVYR